MVGVGGQTADIVVFCPSRGSEEADAKCSRRGVDGTEEDFRVVASFKGIEYD